MKNYKVLFCDLDGTLIETLSGKTFPEGIWDMKIKFDVLDAIKKLSPEYVFIVSNQGGVEKGFVDYVSMLKKMMYIERCVSDYCKVRNVFGSFCPSNNPENKSRKPNTGMLVELHTVRAINYKKQDMLMIGDASGLEGQFSDTDKKTAENFGIDYMDVGVFIKCYGIKQEE